jgi:twitching motility protein PilT
LRAARRVLFVNAMAAVDSLLRLIVVRDAELLIVASGEVPILRKAGEAAPLSMPPLGVELVAVMVGEVVGDARARLEAAGSVEVAYRLPDGTSFALLVERRDAGYRMSCRPAPAPVTTPVVTAGPPRPVLTPVPPPPPAAAPLEPLLARVEHARASDLLLSAGHAPRMRVGGELVELDGGPCTDDQLLALIPATLHPQVDDTGSADAAIVVGELRYRVNVFRQRGGLAAALRPIRRDVPTLEALGLPSDLYELTRPSSGLVLVTGRAGSGKSTTLAALIEHLNRTRPKHVITLEDPVEYEYRPGRCLVHQREVGVHVPSFAAGLRAALRESPDVILVGEMRDRDTMAAALTAAETGHLVLATVHSGGTAGAVHRVIDAFPEGQQHQVRLQLALTLRAVVSQVLVPGPVPPARFPAYEKLVVTAAVASQIRDGKLHQIASLIQTGRDAGMVPLERTLAALVRAGKVARTAAREAALDPVALDDLLRARPTH